MASIVPPELRASLENFGQSHCLTWLDKGCLSSDEASSLVKQLETLDLQRIADAFHSTSSSAPEAGAIEPPDSCETLEAMDEKYRAQCEARGLAEIAEGRAAVIVLGGGQGTRLGFDFPKGMYNIGLPSGKSLFQLYAERVAKLQTLVAAAGSNGVPVVVPLLVMTSPLNHATTADYFAANNFFGLAPEHVHFFPQGTLPALTSGGHIVMTSGCQVSEAPDGNGGIYNALAASGALATLEETYRTRSVHVFSVDNAICKVADPVFLGYCLSKDAEVGNKVVWKAEPHEKVGVVARRGGRPAIVEYTELSAELAEAAGPDGKLLFGAGNICNHYFTVAFLKRVAKAYKETPEVMPYHEARKKVPFADPETGATVLPEAPNGTKLEAFIFDSFPLAARSALLEVNRATEFSPVKNPPGAATDSPDTARAMIMAEHRAWVVAAGGAAGPAGVEVSPLVSYSGEGLASVVGGKTLADGQHIAP
jgi:UDP-N-acetylglucosamine/UDP-N-acetylgalactosamine diphosphorylase